MSNQAKEGFWFIALTLCHAAITICNLGKMPFIVFYHFRNTDLISLMLWTVYALALYLISIKFDDNRKLVIRDFPRAIAFGIIFAVSIGIVETGINAIISFFPYDACWVAVITHIEVLLVGLILFLLLQCKVLKKRPLFSIKRVKVPAIAIVILWAIYIIQVLREFFNFREASKGVLQSTTEWYNLNTYYTIKILNHNTWSYVVLYFLFWWLIQRLCIKEEK
jgi:cytochrome c biogenesis protein CcdA